jgi:hypothetical protein
MIVSHDDTLENLLQVWLENRHSPNYEQSSRLWNTLIITLIFNIFLKKRSGETLSHIVVMPCFWKLLLQRTTTKAQGNRFSRWSSPVMAVFHLTASAISCVLSFEPEEMMDLEKTQILPWHSFTLLNLGPRGAHYRRLRGCNVSHHLPATTTYPPLRVDAFYIHHPACQHSFLYQLFI